MHGLAVLLIPFAVMAFALSMERLQSHLDVAAREPNIVAADPEPAAADAAITAQDANPSADSNVGHLRRAS